MPNDLSSLKSKVDNLNIGKLETTSAALSKLSYEVKDNAVKRIMLAKIKLMPLTWMELSKKKKIIVLRSKNWK